VQVGEREQEQQRLVRRLLVGALPLRKGGDAIAEVVGVHETKVTQRNTAVGNLANVVANALILPNSTNAPKRSLRGT
jgi:hypothetical protein